MWPQPRLGSAGPGCRIRASPAGASAWVGGRLWPNSRRGSGQTAVEAAVKQRRGSGQTAVEAVVKQPPRQRSARGGAGRGAGWAGGGKSGPAAPLSRRRGRRGQRTTGAGACQALALGYNYFILLYNYFIITLSADTAGPSRPVVEQWPAGAKRPPPGRLKRFCRGIRVNTQRPGSRPGVYGPTRLGESAPLFGRQGKTLEAGQEFVPKPRSCTPANYSGSEANLSVQVPHPCTKAFPNHLTVLGVLAVTLRLDSRHNSLRLALSLDGSILIVGRSS